MFILKLCQTNNLFAPVY